MKKATCTNFRNPYNSGLRSTRCEPPAQVVKLVDAGDSKSPAARCVGSSPTLGTKFQNPTFRSRVFCCVEFIFRLLEFLR